VETQIKEYAKKLKLSWIPANYQTIQAETHEEYLLKLFEHEVQQREERRINLLLKQATLPKIPNKPFDCVKADDKIPNIAGIKFPTYN
jgi:DNA replication protein DnaC